LAKIFEKLATMKITKKSLINKFKRANYSEYYNIFEEHTADFFNWFRLKSEKFRFNKDRESIELPNTFIPELGKCYKNSQYYHFFSEFDCFEGFAFIGGTNTQFINHAFNVKDRNLEDFTYYSNKEEVIRMLGSLPDFYVGVRIPGDIMDEIFNRLEIDVDETRTNISLSISLLIAYYIIDSGKDWDINNFVSPVE